MSDYFVVHDGVITVLFLCIAILIGSYSQLPTPIRPISAHNISTHTGTNRTTTASSVREARSSLSKTTDGGIK